MAIQKKVKCSYRFDETLRDAILRRAEKQHTDASKLLREILNPIFLPKKKSTHEK